MSDSAVKHTIERFLIDGEDRQTQRSWFFEVSGDFITIRRVDGGDHLMLLKVADVDQFCADMKDVASRAAN